MDEVLGAENFVSQIVLKTTSGAGSPSGGTLTLAGVNDYALWFAKDRGRVKYRQLFADKSESSSAALYRRVLLTDGSERLATSEEMADPALLPTGARLFRPDNLTSQSSPDSATYPVEINGRNITPGKGGWKTNPSGMAKLKLAGRLYETRNHSLQYVRFMDDFPAMPLNNVWTDVGTGSFTEDKVYVVQTNTKIVQRCVLMTTDPGDLVLDPTCGSGTTAHVAEAWGRRWITIDTSRVSLALARQRIMGARYSYYLLRDSDEGRRADRLPPAPTFGDLRQGFLYQRVPHVMLKSIANNPDIRAGMTRDQIDAAIKRHADFEFLYDQPLEDKSKVRVAGPFTVESLSPHRSVSFEHADDLRPGAVDAEQPSFDQSILANLRAAGIQNGRKSERLEFASIDDYPGVYVQAIGTQKDTDDQPVAISIGPQYGTVSAAFIKSAAREAIETGAPLVAVLGFAFDPQLGVETDEEGFAVVAGVRDLGRIKVLVVRMNVDLLMGEELKKTGAGNLFTVFGEPDLAIERSGDQWTVKVTGVDVYDPTSGEVRSNSTDEIALWMVDTDYDGESFFVRHAYFLGDNDPYKSLKTALKADIDQEAWETLYRSTSVPFDAPASGRIAVKVINDYGDEVMKVLEVG